jgi:hypothetical protein
MSGVRVPQRPLIHTRANRTRVGGFRDPEERLDVIAARDADLVDERLQQGFALRVGAGVDGFAPSEPEHREGRVRDGPSGSVGRPGRLLHPRLVAGYSNCRVGQSRFSDSVEPGTIGGTRNHPKVSLPHGILVLARRVNDRMRR